MTWEKAATRSYCSGGLKLQVLGDPSTLEMLLSGVLWQWQGGWLMCSPAKGWVTEEERKVPSWCWVHQTSTGRTHSCQQPVSWEKQHRENPHTPLPHTPSQVCYFPRCHLSWPFSSQTLTPEFTFCKEPHLAAVFIFSCDFICLMVW